MSDDNYDDGLVHEHRWASEKVPPHDIEKHEHEFFDDGIEHGPTGLVPERMKLL